MKITVTIKSDIQAAKKEIKATLLFCEPFFAFLKNHLNRDNLTFQSTLSLYFFCIFFVTENQNKPQLF